MYSQYIHLVLPRPMFLISMDDQSAAGAPRELVRLTRMPEGAAQLFRPYGKSAAILLQAYTRSCKDVWEESEKSRARIVLRASHLTTRRYPGLTSWALLFHPFGIRARFLKCKER